VSRDRIGFGCGSPMSVGSDFNEEFLRTELRKRPDLISYWWRIFISFALTGTHVLAPFKPSSRDEILHMEQVAFAMEIFGVAHEYAHHALDHGRTVVSETDAHREEFEADAFALKICKIVEADHRYAWVKGQSVTEQTPTEGFHVNSNERTAHKKLISCMVLYFHAQ
jgi:hypothetical protein